MGNPISQTQASLASPLCLHYVGFRTMEDLDYTIVDVETTGLSPQADRIIEIGALVVQKGKLIKKFSSLVNPQRPLPPFIEELTGIRSQDLQDAPVFEDLAEEIEGLFQGRTLVAHNARFDYGFIRNELERVGRELQTKCLCTARLSRKLFPSVRGHSLDKVMSRLGIPCRSRHRALDDAGVLWEFIQKILQDFKPQTLQVALADILKTPTYPPGLDPSMVRDLPKSPGVYVFYNQEDAPLYVGKSVRIRERVLSHFSSDHRAGKELALCRQTTQIKSFPTAGELGALLLESHLIKKLNPWFNRRSRESRQLVVLRKSLGSSGYYKIRMERLESLNPWELEEIQGIFRSQRQAKKFVSELAKEYELCPKLLDLEKGKGPCFSIQLKKCRGACLDDENSLKYNLRFEEAFQKTKVQSWPFRGPIMIEEKMPGEEQGEIFVVDRWCLVGQIRYDELTQAGIPLKAYSFDLDSYKILLRFIRDRRNKKKIRSYRIPKAIHQGQMPLPGVAEV